MNTRSISRIFTLGLSAAALAACGDNGGTTVGTEGATSEEGTTDGQSTTPTTTNTTKTSVTGMTTDEPTGGTGGATSDATSDATTDATTDATDATSDGTTTELTATGTTDTPAVCGDGVVGGTEQCDGGEGCEADCTLTPVCGNNNVENGEACDDGNTDDGDACSADCLVATPPAECGNGEIEDPEACDNGPDVPDDGCEADCTVTPPECGNGKVEGDEACDDGNNTNGGPGDFCKNDCSVFMPASCAAPAMYTNCDDNIVLTDKNDKKNALKAIGICDGELATSIVTTDFQFESTSGLAWQVAKGFGTYKFDHDQMPGTPDQLIYSPREGSNFLMMSTGTILPPNPQGIVIEPPNSQGGKGENGNNDDNALPPPFQTKVGSANGAGGTPFQQCDGVNDCSDTLQAQWAKGFSDPNDRMWFTFKTKVPLGTFGYTFDFVFCSSEWPVWVDSAFNDLLSAYQVDPAADDRNAEPPIDAYTGNVTFVPDPNDATKGLPLTITALDPYYDGPGYTLQEPQLAGTGFEQHACTDWFTAKGGVQPGSDITIGFYIADMGDTALATLALLDNFRWDCEGCVPSEVDDCGVQDPQ